MIIHETIGWTDLPAGLTIASALELLADIDASPAMYGVMPHKCRESTSEAECGAAIPSPDAHVLWITEDSSAPLCPICHPTDEKSTP